MGLYEAEGALQSEVEARGARAIVIGPAGENQVPFTAVSNDGGHRAGRMSMGGRSGVEKG